MSSLISTTTILLTYLTATVLSHPPPPPPPPPQQITPTTLTPGPNPIQLPLIIWHGLGDDTSNKNLHHLTNLANTTNPGTHVHLIHLSPSPSQDRQASFLGNLTTQLAEVCDQLSAHPILSTAPAVNALGFSQGGQFLRGFVERCNVPRVRNLVTFGSQHNGIDEFWHCGGGDWVCRSAESLVRFGRWSPLVQGGVVPAQYFRDASDADEFGRYLERSNFLADVNNERPVKNRTYRENLAGLNRFALVMFEDDEMVNSRESAWFAEVSDDGEKRTVTPLRERRLYQEDWLGLRELDERGGLDFVTAPGGHMELSDSLLERTFREYFGPIWGVSTDASRGNPNQGVLVKQG